MAWIVASEAWCSESPQFDVFETQQEAQDHANELVASQMKMSEDWRYLTTVYVAQVDQAVTLLGRGRPLPPPPPSPPHIPRPFQVQGED